MSVLYCHEHPETLELETTVAHDAFDLLGFLYRAGFTRSPRLAFVKRLDM